MDEIKPRPPQKPVEHPCVDCGNQHAPFGQVENTDTGKRTVYRCGTCLDRKAYFKEAARRNVQAS